MKRARIYLDHNASTPLCAAALEAMQRVLCSVPGNPSSVHSEGERARDELATARDRVAALLGAQPDEIIFTSGATEANHTVFANLARDRAPAAISTSSVEHPSVEQPLARLEKRGWQITRHAVSREGQLDPGEFLAALRSNTQLVSLIAANNETGVVFPIGAIADGLRERGIRLHVDATQWIGKLAIDLRALPVDFLACSAHKLGGPKGVGCLFVRRGVEFEGELIGGSQERRRRAGTENLAGIAGFGAACEESARTLASEAPRLRALRDRLWQGLVERVPGVLRNGDPEAVLPNTLNAAFPGAIGELLLQALDLDGIAVSAGAACASGSLAPSPVLLAMGLGAERSAASLRFSLGPASTEAEIECVLELLPAIVERVRASGAAR
jgi:cysteine desulfurase